MNQAFWPTYLNKKIIAFQRTISSRIDAETDLHDAKTIIRLLAAIELHLGKHRIYECSITANMEQYGTFINESG